MGVEDDDVTLTYSGPFAAVPRPMTPNSIRSLMRAASVLFAFLGDPVPNANAAADALAMAREIAVALDGLTPGWGDLGYGVGLAFGEATVGLVGFEGRIDYTPVGACVNLAARLCADAQPGEIVIDESLRVTAGSVTTRSSVDLKGFGAVTTYRLSR